jgi:hypothetical protein
MILPGTPHEVHPTLHGFGRTDPASRWDYIASPNPTARTCWVKFCRGIRSDPKRRRVCSKCRARLDRLNHPLEAVFRTLRDNARRRGKPFELTLEDFRQVVTESGYIDARGRHVGMLHIDRENPLLGYVRGNIRVLESGENSAKGATFDKARWAAERRGEPYRQQLDFYDNPPPVPALDPDDVGF